MLAAIEIAIGNERESSARTFSPEGLYGLGREKGNMLRPGDSLYGAAIAGAVASGERSTRWSMATWTCALIAPPAAVTMAAGAYGERSTASAAEHRVTHAARVNSAEEGWALSGRWLHDQHVFFGRGFKDGVTRKA